MPESAAKFFVDGVEDARFTFNKNGRGDVISLTRWQFVEQLAQRVPKRGSPAGPVSNNYQVTQPQPALESVIAALDQPKCQGGLLFGAIVHAARLK